MKSPSERDPDDEAPTHSADVWNALQRWNHGLGSTSPTIFFGGSATSSAESMDSIRVIVVEDEPLFRDLLVNAIIAGIPVVVCGGRCSGATSENLEGIQALRNEVRDLGKVNEILRQVSVCAAASELSLAIPGCPRHRQSLRAPWETKIRENRGEELLAAVFVISLEKYGSTQRRNRTQRKGGRHGTVRARTEIA